MPKFLDEMGTQVPKDRVTSLAKDGKCAASVMAMLRSSFGGCLRDIYAMLSQDVRVVANWTERRDATKKQMEGTEGVRTAPRGSGHLVHAHREWRGLLMLPS